ncbi:MAG: TonB-dependent receptor [Gammaproteobacteria bacterium]|nr:TonB-dependent receptor [Gammaproteobacteria bacterium]
MHVRVFLLLFFSIFVLTQEVEEVITTGSLIKDIEANSLPVELITKEDFDDLNINSVAEISKYLSSSSGSHFQTNALDGVDQGMSNITLRGLDHASTLVLINSKRQTFSGTTSQEGEGYIDMNIIPVIAFEKVEILKEGATSLYGSDSVAGVINFFTYKEFDGFKLKFGEQNTTNYESKETNVGFLYGAKNWNIDLVIAYDQLEKKPLSANEIPRIAELGLSPLGNTFIVSADDEIAEGLYAGNYTENQIVPDPNCVENGGILSGGYCRFLYGTRFNIVNDEDHQKFYLSLSNKNHEFTSISSNIKVNDNPQSPSYPALSFLTRSIQPGEAGSPFNVPVRWYGRPLGGLFPSPLSPKDITQHHINYTYMTTLDDYDIEFSITNSEHENKHNRPDFINSRFLDAIQGNGGPNGDLLWNVFNPRENSRELTSYLQGAEKSNKKGGLTTLDFLVSSKYSDISFVAGAQISNEQLNITFNEIAQVESDEDGKLTKTADLFFLGGGRNISKSRDKFALFVEAEREFFNVLDLRLAMRYEDYSNDSSFDPKLSLRYQPSEKVAFRFSRGTSFTMPSMAQMFPSDVNLGSVLDGDNGGVYVRQAKIGNPDLKPATSTNTNLGFIFNDNIQKFTLDYWEIDFEDRIILQSPQALLDQDPNGSSITRNDIGDLIGVTTTYFNEESTIVSGIDFEYKRFFNLKNYGELDLTIRGTNLIEFLTPDRNDVTCLALDCIQLIDRVGKFNFDSNTHALPENRINAFIKWKFNNYIFGINTRYIDGYTNDTPIPQVSIDRGYSNKVDSSFLLDFSVDLPLSDLFTIDTIDGDYELKTNFAIINLFDEDAPRLYDAPDFSFDTRVHDPRGRMLSIQFELAKK